MEVPPRAKKPWSAGAETRLDPTSLSLLAVASFKMFLDSQIKEDREKQYTSRDRWWAVRHRRYNKC